LTGSADVAATPDGLEARAAAPRRGWRLTLYFAALVAVFAVAATAAGIYVFVQTDRDSRGAAESDARFAADTAARQLGEGVATVKATVAGLAATPNIEQAAAMPTCSLSFGVGELSSGHLDVLRPDGMVACSSRTGEKPLPGYVGAGWLSGVTADTTLFAPVVDRATGERSVLVAARTPGNAIVVAFLALEPVAQGLAKLYGGGRPVEFLVASGDGKQVLTRSIAPGRWVGAPLAGTAFARAAGEVERRDLDGRTRLYAQSAVPGVGWQFYVGEDKAAALAAGNDLRERQLLIILVGLVLALLATFVVYRRVAVPIRRLGSHVRSTASKSLPEPVPVSGPAEVTALGADVNELISSVGRELRQREQAEESVRASERSYRVLFENSPLPMWIYDSDTLEILAVNDAAVAGYGHSREDFLALTLADLVAPGEDMPGARDTEAKPSSHRRRDGGELKVRTFAHEVTFDGRSACCVVAEEVGERERLESQLRQAQKMEAVGQLAGGVAHDFNNLLTVISGYGAMARNRIGVGPGTRELLEIDRAAERAAQLTQQLLAFSRQQVLEAVVLDLNEVVGTVMPMLTRLIGENVEIGVLAETDAPPVLADRGQVEQVIVNLAVNARDAMPDGGTITIETRTVRLDERYSTDHPGVLPGVYACLSVTDTGIGIAPETQSRIFEPFFTTKDVGAGTGLGLATVHGIVKQSGGHVEVYSEPGLGTSFKVYLPAAVGEPLVRASAPRERPLRLGGDETVLVCEDDELVRTLIETMLSENGYLVLPTARPDEALAIAAHHGGQIDVLVTDVVMPLMTGPELVKRLTVARPGLKVLLLSGYSAESVRDRVLPEGSVFLQKPFDDVTLLEQVRALLDGEPRPARVRRAEQELS
jgi:two-component system cell cycle sensor histidine kinase/response regulator CckA